MIVSVTPNPSLDRTLEIGRLDRGEIIRASSATVEAGGKGVNVARALLANKQEAAAVLPVGGPEGDHLAALLEQLGLDVRLVPIRGHVRTNVSLVEPDGTVTKVNAAGPDLTAGEVAALRDATVALARSATWVAGSGSLPPGAPDDLYADLAGAVRGAGARMAVDTSGAPLARAVAGGPDLLKPNEDELAAVAGQPLGTLGAVVDAAQEVRRAGVGAVLVSLGRHGALLVDGQGVWHATTPPLVPRSNVGAGDATLAGFLAAGGAGPDALRQAVAWGAAAVRLTGTAMPGPGDIDLDAVQVGAPDPQHALTPAAPQPGPGTTDDRREQS